MKKTPGDIIIDNHWYNHWHFFHFYLPNKPKNQNLKKTKKMPRDIIILHKCTKNRDHMLRFSWDMARDGCNFYFSFWDIFCPFAPLTTKKTKLKKKKMKKAPGDIILQLCPKNYADMIFSSWDMVHDGRPGGRTDGRTETVTYRGGFPT